MTIAVDKLIELEVGSNYQVKPNRLFPQIDAETINHSVLSSSLDTKPEKEVSQKITNRINKCKDKKKALKLIEFATQVAFNLTSQTVMLLVFPIQIYIMQATFIWYFETHAKYFPKSSEYHHTYLSIADISTWELELQKYGIKGQDKTEFLEFT